MIENKKEYEEEIKYVETFDMKNIIILYIYIIVFIL